jgi:D-alanine-D-alanine ligase
MSSVHIVVLMGGWSAEREVSLTSGAGVADALESRGHRVTRIDMGRDIAQRLAEAAPDVVFNALHGTPGEDGTVQGMMDLMGLRYTHSGPRHVRGGAIDKELTKQVLVPHGIRMPPVASWRAKASKRPIRCRGPMCSSRSTRARPSGVPSSPTAAIMATRSAADMPGPWQEFDQLLAEPFIRGPGADRGGARRRGARSDRAPAQDGLLRLCRQIYGRPHRAHLPRRRPAAITDEAMRMALAAHRISAAAARRAPTSAGTTSRASTACICLRSTPSPA